MLLICPQLALAMPFSHHQPAPAVTKPEPAAPRAHFWHGVLALATTAAMYVLGVDGNLPLHY